MVKIMNISKQEGGADCGLFAIAIATALLRGTPPVACTFVQEDEAAPVQLLQKGKNVPFSMRAKTVFKEGRICRNSLCVLRLSDARAPRHGEVQ